MGAAGRHCTAPVSYRPSRLAVCCHRGRAGGPSARSPDALVVAAALRRAAARDRAVLPRSGSRTPPTTGARAGAGGRHRHVRGSRARRRGAGPASVAAGHDLSLPARRAHQPHAGGGTRHARRVRAGTFLPAYRHDAHKNEHSEIWIDHGGTDGRRPAGRRRARAPRRLPRRGRATSAGAGRAHRADEVRIAHGRLRAALGRR